MSDAAPKPKGGKPRWRRYLRRTAKGMAIALGVVLLLVVIAGVALETQSARDLVRDKVEAQLGEIFVGDVSIGEVASNPLSRLELRDIVINGPDGRPAIKLDLLLVEFSLAGALDQTIRIEKVALEGLEIWARVDDEGQWNLARLVRPSEEEEEPPEPPGEPSSWQVVVDQVAIEGRMHAPDEADYPLSVSLANANAGADAITLESFAVSLGDVRIDVAPTRFEPPTGALESSVEVAIVRDVVGSFVGDVPGPEGVALSLSARRQRAGQPFEIDATVETSDGQQVNADVALTPEQPAVRGTVTTRGLNIQALSGADVPSKLDADIELDIAGAGPREMVGTVALSASGRLLAEKVKKAELRLAADKGAFEVELGARYAGVAADLTSKVRLEGDDFANDVVVDDLQATFVAADLARAVDGRAPVSGRVEIDVEARGTPDNIEGRVKIKGRNVVASDMRIGDVFVSAEAEQSGDRTRLSSLVVRAAGASLKANANLQGDAIKARLGRLEIAIADVARLIGFKGRAGGSVIVGGEVAMTPGGTTSGDLKLETRNVRWGAMVSSLDSTFSARLRPGRLNARLDATDSGQPLGQLSLRVDSRTPADALDGAAWASRREQLLRSLALDWRGARIDAATLKRYGVDVEARAGVTAKLDIADRGSRVDFSVTVEDASSEYLAAATNANLKVGLAAGKLEAALETKTEEVGTIDLRARARAPRRWTDGAAWSMAGPAWLEEAGLDVTVNLPGLRPFGVPDDVGGRATLKVEAGAEAEVVRATIAATATSEQFEGPLGVESKVDLQAESSTVGLQVSVGGDRLVAANVAGAVGTRALLAGDTGAVESAGLEGTLDAKKLRIEKLLAIAKQRDVAATGELDIEVAVAGTPMEPVVDARVRSRGVRVESVAVPALAVDARATRAEVEASVVATGLELRATADLTREPLPISATLAADKFALGFLEPLVAGLEGKLSGDVEVSGTAVAPMAKGELRIDGLGLAAVGPVDALRKGTVVVSVAQTREAGAGGGSNGDLVTKLELSADARAGDGTVDVSANGVLDGRGLRLARAHLEADKLELRTAVKARLGTEVDMAIDRDGAGVLRGRVDVGDTLIVVEQSSSDARDLYETGTLEDVVVVGPDGRVLGPDGEPIDPSEAEAGEEYKGPPRVVVDIKAPRTIQVFAPEGQLVLDADLKAKAVPGFSLEGTVTSDDGRVELFGRNYRLDRFMVGFAGNPAEPNLDIRLSYDFPRFTMSIELSGTPDEPELVLRSDPAIYDEPELLAFVLGGEPNAAADEGGDLGAQARSAAAGLLASKVQDAVKDRLPVDVLRLELAEDGASAAKVTVGKWITRRLFVAYRQNFGAERTENSGEARVEYRLLRNLLLEGYFGDANAAGVDLFWIRRF